MGEMFVGAEEAIAQTAEGRMVVVTDAEDRENEGDLVVAAEFATAEVDELHGAPRPRPDLPGARRERAATSSSSPLRPIGESAFDTAFTVSSRRADGVTTGISAHDRRTTIQAPSTPPPRRRTSCARPRLSPARAARRRAPRAGHTEAAVELARLAGLKPAPG